MKILKILLFISCLLICVFLVFFDANENKLKKLGYKKEEILILTSKLEKEELDTILNHEYEQNLVSFVENSNFEFSNVMRYLDYADQHQTLTSDEIISIVNLNLDDITYHEDLLTYAKEAYFIKENWDRYLKYQEQKKKEISEIIREVNVHIDTPFYSNDIPSDTTKGNLIIANKYYTLEKDFVPDHLVTLTKYKTGTQKVTKETANAYLRMAEAMEKEGLHLIATSAYRSYERQEYLYQNYVKEHGVAWADRASSKAGHSEHQTGLTIDVTSKTSDFNTFQETKEFAWLQDHAHEYGFILRYPEGKEYLTGYKYEPWHYRYVGVEVASEIKKLNITFDEYYEYFIK